ncbi:MAG TPA: EndoU domain-containing protein [Cytophagales bacterium]|nr:EndoU domain-containing protein [Cytophagales bacterium]
MSALTKFFLLFFLPFFVACAQPSTLIGEKAKKHIFEGEIKERKGKKIATGCHHYAAVLNGIARIIVNTESLGPRGIFKGRVMLYDPRHKIWVKKVANGGYSTFFPKDWSIQKTLQEITHAYEHKDKVSRGTNEYKGLSSEGIEIRMYLKEGGEIISAFPADWK